MTSIFLNSYKCNKCNKCNSFKYVIKRRIGDTFIQKWCEELFNSGECTNYKIFKTNLILEKYI